MFCGRMPIVSRKNTFGGRIDGNHIMMIGLYYVNAKMDYTGLIGYATTGGINDAGGRLTD